MPEAVLSIFKDDWGTHASIFVMIVLVPAVLVALYNKHTLDVGPITLLVFSAAALASGTKILLLTLCMTTAQLGPLGDDKPTLLLGGIAALVVAAREALTNWKKVAGI